KETEADPQVARLTTELIEAPAEKQEKLIEQYKNGKGVVYTQALSAAIPELSGAVQSRARDALAERLTRMTATTLRDKLKDANPEIRFAAARACATKEDQTHVPDLIDLLEDPVPRVVRAARAALKYLTREDFGPKDSSAPERERAVAQ